VVRCDYQFHCDGNHDRNDSRRPVVLCTILTRCTKPVNLEDILVLIQFRHRRGLVLDLFAGVRARSRSGKASTPLCTLRANASIDSSGPSSGYRFRCVSNAAVGRFHCRRDY